MGCIVLNQGKGPSKRVLEGEEGNWEQKKFIRSIGFIVWNFDVIVIVG